LAIIDWLAGLWAVPVGIGLGLIFYGGLWLTVQYVVQKTNPAPLLMVSFLLRAGVTLGGFYLVGGGRIERTVLCLVGFVLTRVVMVNLKLGPTKPGKQGGSNRAT